MQQIVSQLIFAGAEDVDIHATSPWLEKRQLVPDEVLAQCEAQTHRRFIKSHLPIDALVFSPEAKYICVLRDGRDTMWSWHNYIYHATPYFYEYKNKGAEAIGKPLQRPDPDPRVEFMRFLENDEDETRANSPFWPYVRGWWAARDLPNVHIVHFADLKTNMDTEIRKIAKFLGIDISSELWPTIIEHCTFEYMKGRSAQYSLPGSDKLYEQGADTFINKGTNGRWKDSLSKADIESYEKKAREELGEECALWLAKDPAT